MSQTDTTVTSQFDITLLYWAIGIVGGCIAITLIYVSYKKYRGEKKRNNEDIYRHHDQE